MLMVGIVGRPSRLTKKTEERLESRRFTDGSGVAGKRAEAKVEVEVEDSDDSGSDYGGRYDIRESVVSGVRVGGRTARGESSRWEF
jgi:hypothetical protein